MAKTTFRPKNLLEKLMSPFGHRPKGGQEDDLEAIAAKEQKLFPYSVLANATRNFNAASKLGEGGFGAVYKGTLRDGRVVAVKKLSMGSRQGTKEFKNEAMLLSRVQHRNIVNLYGYCTTGDGDDGKQPEKLLVYEYIPHESLDKILFDAKKRGQLNWNTRFGIIIGIARGLLYLHEDCHTTIIHRDVKASNILLDDKWIPKIADFGMARLYPEDQTHVNTRVAGTNGYMAPEYLMHGQLSTKADVFSFGVLVLELVSGRKNSTFIPEADAESLLEWAYKLHKRGHSKEMMDPALDLTASEEQFARSVHIGLLCVQADPKLRPDMKRAVVMLSKKPSSMPEPSRPGFPGSRYRRPRRLGRSGFSGHTSSSPPHNSSYVSTSASHSKSASTSASHHTSSASTSTTTKNYRSSSQEKHSLERST